VICRRDGAHDQLKALAPKLTRMRLRAADGDLASRAILEAVKVPEFDHIILMSYTHLPMQEADAQTLICLLHLRNIAEAAGVDLNIVSDKLVSLMLSQLSENKHLDAVFRQLFAAEGSEVYIRPIGDYVRPGVPVNFHTVLEAAARRGETAIGYRLQVHAEDATRGYGVKVNPNKSEVVTFAAADKIVVLAED
jgi:hypothetical protein